MRKQCQGLKNVGGSPLRRGNINSTRGIEQYVAAGRDTSLVRPRKSGDAIEQRGLAGSGSSKQNRDAGRNFHAHIKDKGGGARAAPLFANPSGEQWRVYFACH